MSIVFTRRKTLVCLVVALNLVAARAVAIAASASDRPPSTNTLEQAASTIDQPTSTLQAPTSVLEPPSGTLQIPTTSTFVSRPAPRPAFLVPLYVSLASLQALDVASTLEAIHNGTGVEANPIMRGALGSPAGVVALKAGFTGLTIFASEKMWKKNRTAAILMMLGVNGAYAAIVAHNYSVARGK